MMRAALVCLLVCLPLLPFAFLLLTYLRQADAPQQVLEARVLAQLILHPSSLPFCSPHTFLLS
jgi:hypothetical protein